MNSKLERAVASVVANGNCSGCGMCTLLSANISMASSEQGFLRPVFDPAPSADQGSPTSDKQVTKEFKAMCPGRRVEAPKNSAPFNHPVFGAYFGVWQGAAIDSDIRFAGSSGGVLTALSAWLVESDRSSQVVACSAGSDEPSRSIPVRIMTREEALQASGSRYAPVAMGTSYPLGQQSAAFVGKPCEVAAAAALEKDHQGKGEGPIRLSFFCAGTPSQKATESLVDSLGVSRAEVRSLRYRGNGWPGDFTVNAGDLSQKSLSYEESWGQHLGRDLQWRCKICVDGVGELSDIAVGDYWQTDDRGYPTFDDGAGSSVVIARTARGQQILENALKEGVIDLTRIGMDSLMNVQPLQRIRRITIIGRLAGRILAGRRIPSYRGFSLIQLLRKDMKGNARAGIGTFLRSLRNGK